jgi:hypothetical protein
MILVVLKNNPLNNTKNLSQILERFTIHRIAISGISLFSRQKLIFHFKTSGVSKHSQEFPRVGGNCDILESLHSCRDKYLRMAMPVF